MSWRALNRNRWELGQLLAFGLVVDVLLWIFAVPMAMKLYWVACLVLAVLLGVMSHLTGISPIAMLLGGIGLVLMLSCTLAPLLPDYDRFKDQRQHPRN
ncbi:MAG: hypothetical protein AAF085_12490 [Planctomycetota bacterium]